MIKRLAIICLLLIPALLIHARGPYVGDSFFQKITRVRELLVKPEPGEILKKDHYDRLFERAWKQDTYYKNWKQAWEYLVVAGEGVSKALMVEADTEGGSEYRQWVAARLLGDMGHVEVVPISLRLLQQKNENDWQAPLIEDLGKMGAVESVPYLVSLYVGIPVPAGNDFGGDWLANLQQALVRLGEADVVLDRLERQESWIQQWGNTHKVVMGRIRRGEKTAKSEIADAVRDERAQLLVDLHACKEPRCAQWLVERLTDEDPSARWRARGALIWMGDIAGPYLVNYLENEQGVFARARFLETVIRESHFKGDALVPGLVRQLEEPRLAGPALSALEKQGGSAAAAAIENYLQNSPPSQAQTALRNLEEMSRDNIELLESMSRLLYHQDAGVRVALIETLAKAGAPGLSHQMELMMNDEDAAVRKAASFHLPRFYIAELVERLRQALPAAFGSLLRSNFGLSRYFNEDDFWGRRGLRTAHWALTFLSLLIGLLLLFGWIHPFDRFKFILLLQCLILTGLAGDVWLLWEFKSGVEAPMGVRLLLLFGMFRLGHGREPGEPPNRLTVLGTWIFIIFLPPFFYLGGEVWAQAIRKIGMNFEFALSALFLSLVSGLLFMDQVLPHKPWIRDHKIKNLLSQSLNLSLVLLLSVALAMLLRDTLATGRANDALLTLMLMAPVALLGLVSLFRFYKGAMKQDRPARLDPPPPESRILPETGIFEWLLNIVSFCFSPVRWLIYRLFKVLLWPRQSREGLYRLRSDGSMIELTLPGTKSWKITLPVTAIGMAILWTTCWNVAGMGRWKSGLVEFFGMAALAALGFVLAWAGCAMTFGSEVVQLKRGWARRKFTLLGFSIGEGIWQRNLPKLKGGVHIHPDMVQWINDLLRRARGEQHENLEKAAQGIKAELKHANLVAEGASVLPLELELDSGTGQRFRLADLENAAQGRVLHATLDGKTADLCFNSQDYAQRLGTGQAVRTRPTLYSDFPIRAGMQLAIFSSGLGRRKDIVKAVLTVLFVLFLVPVNAIRSMAVSSGFDATESAILALEDNSDESREWAIKQILNAFDWRALPTLVEAWDTLTQQQRRQLAQKLSGFKGYVDPVFVETLLSDGDSQVRASALSLVERYGLSDEIPLLLQLEPQQGVELAAWIKALTKAMIRQAGALGREYHPADAALAAREGASDPELAEALRGWVMLGKNKFTSYSQFEDAWLNVADSTVDQVLWEMWAGGDAESREQALTGLARRQDPSALRLWLKRADDELQGKFEFYNIYYTVGRRYGDQAAVPLLEALGRAKSPSHEQNILRGFSQVYISPDSIYRKQIETIAAGASGSVKRMADDLLLRTTKARDRRVKKALAAAFAPGSLLALSLLAAAGGVILFLAAFRILKFRAFLKTLAPVSAASVPTGMVRLKGHAQPAGAYLHTPVGGEACIHYAGADKKFPEHRFYLADSSGRVLVDPRGAILVGGDEIIQRGERLQVMGYARPRGEDDPGKAERVVGKMNQGEKKHSMFRTLLKILLGPGASSGGMRMMFEDPRDFFWIWEDGVDRPLEDPGLRVVLMGTFLISGVWTLMFFFLAVLTAAGRLDPLIWTLTRTLGW